MPLWQVYHPPAAYTAADRQRFAADVTDIYVRAGLPRFYVVVLFQEIEGSSFLVGGETAGTTVRVVVDHIARHAGDPTLRRLTSEAVGRVLALHTTDRGLSCEFHIDETPRDMWMIDGLSPPPSRSEAERLWVRENRPVPY
jgi:phenylpyruvate tautomerase PptA (4-oxalocrotonate tautomerase family)